MCLVYLAHFIHDISVCRGICVCTSQVELEKKRKMEAEHKKIEAERKKRERLERQERELRDRILKNMKVHQQSTYIITILTFILMGLLFFVLDIVW